MAFRLLEGAEGHRGRRAASSRRSAASAHGAARRRTSTSSCQALPVDERKQHAGADHHRDAAAARGASGVPAEHHGRATRSAAAKARAASRSRANILGPDLDQLADYSLKALGGGAASCRASPSRRSSLNVSNPEIHVAVDRKRAADLGVRMATIGNTLRLAVAGDDEISFYKEGAGAVPGQDPRAREPAPRHRGRSAGSPCRRRPARSASTTSRGSSAASARRTLQRSNRQFTVDLIADVAPGHALDEASNDVRKMLAGLNMPPTMSFKLQGQSKILDETTDQPDHGDRPGDDLRLHGARGAVRELRPADRHHAGAADRRCRSRCSRSGSPAGR